MIRRNRAPRHSIFPRFLTTRYFTSAGPGPDVARTTPPLRNWQRSPLPPYHAERRAKKDRRRRIDPTTFEKQYTPDEMEFMNAMQRFKESSGKSFPSHGDVLRVAVALGYRHVIDEPDPSDDEMLVDDPCRGRIVHHRCGRIIFVTWQAHPRCSLLNVP